MTELVKTYPPHRRDLPKAEYVYMTSKTYNDLRKEGCIRPPAGPLNLEWLDYPESERFNRCEIIVDDALERDNWLFDRPSATLVPQMIREQLARKLAHDGFH